MGYLRYFQIHCDAPECMNVAPDGAWGSIAEARKTARKRGWRRIAKPCRGNDWKSHEWDRDGRGIDLCPNHPDA